MDEIKERVEILLVEDNPGDIRLTVEALKENTMPNKLNVVNDGADALTFLYKRGKYADAPRPDLILLDLNLPKMNGLEILEEIKKDPALKRIPVVIFTASSAQRDILNSYNHHANCYITKPVHLEQFIAVVKSIENFWLNVVKLPQGD